MNDYGVFSVCETYNVQEVQRRGCVQIPVQFVQNDSFHPQDL